MITERRQHPRKTPTEFTFIQLEQEFGGRVLNYSTNGLCFETSTPICDTDLVQFWLSFPRHGQVDGVGKITWLSEKRNLGGITFVHLSRASRQKIDELTSPVSEHEAESVAGETEDGESPQAIVSHLMEQVLAERRKSSVVARPLVTHADHAAAAAAAAQAQEVEPAEPSMAASSEVFTPTEVDAISSAAVAIPSEPPPPETRISDTAQPFAAPVEQLEDRTNADATATVEARESTEGANDSLPPVFTPITPESFDLWSMTGSGEPRPARSSPSPSVLDSTALQSIPERESSKDAVIVAENVLRDDKARKWPVPSALVTTTFVEPTDPSTIQDSSPEEMTGWVPLKQYFYARWAQFLRGAAVGTGISLLIAVVILTFWKPTERGTLTEGTANAVSANSSIAEGATAPEPVPLTLGSQGPELSPTRQNMITPGKSHVAGADSSATGLPSRASGVASVPNPAPSSAQDSPETSSNAIPRRSSFAHRNAEPESGSQPLFELSQPGNPDGPAAETEPGNGQPNLRVDLGSTPWTFRRKNIHGNAPVGGDLRPAELVRYVAPLYPEPARTRHISGEVVIDAMIDAQGNVRKPQVVSGPSLLRSAALNAVSAWKYKPALLDGKPTEVHETITLKFDAQ